MESEKLEFYNEQSGAKAVLTFTMRDDNKINLNVSVTHPQGLSRLKLERYTSMWQKFGGLCLAMGMNGQGLPRLPDSWVEVLRERKEVIEQV